MHSKIFQVSIQPIEVDDYCSSDDFYENNDFADYIGDVLEGDDRKACIGYLADTLKDLFAYDPNLETLTYKGEGAMEAFKKAWAACLHEEAAKVTADNILDLLPLIHVSRTCEETHLGTSYRFYIENYNGYAAPAIDLIEYVADKMKAGDKLYIGAVVGYHF